jgi:hypothetical protein
MFQSLIALTAKNGVLRPVVRQAILENQVGSQGSRKRWARFVPSVIDIKVKISYVGVTFGV